MGIGSTFFAASAISIFATINSAIRAMGGNHDWFTFLLTVGSLIITIVSLYIGFRLFRNGMGRDKAHRIGETLGV